MHDYNLACYRFHISFIKDVAGNFLKDGAKTTQ